MKNDRPFKVTIRGWLKDEFEELKKEGLVDRNGEKMDFLYQYPKEEEQNKQIKVFLYIKASEVEAFVKKVAEWERSPKISMKEAGVREGAQKFVQKKREYENKRQAMRKPRELKEKPEEEQKGGEKKEEQREEKREERKPFIKNFQRRPFKRDEEKKDFKMIVVTGATFNEVKEVLPSFIMLARRENEVLVFRSNQVTMGQLKQIEGAELKVVDADQELYQQVFDRRQQRYQVVHIHTDYVRMLLLIQVIQVIQLIFT